MSAPAQKIAYVDFAKGYAIFTIVLYHAWQQVDLPPLLRQGIVFGGTGVHSFSCFPVLDWRGRERC